MPIPEERGEQAIEAALMTLAGAFGIPRENVLLAFIDKDPNKDGDSAYWTHVGRNVNERESLLLEMTAVDLQREAHEQMMAVLRGTPCPNCGSPRYAMKQDGKDFPKVDFYDQCMDCGHRSAKR